MVKIEVKPIGIARVVIEAEHEMERTADSATLILLEPFLRNIDRELKLAMQNFLHRKERAWQS